LLAVVRQELLHRTASNQSAAEPEHITRFLSLLQTFAAALAERDVAAARLAATEAEALLIAQANDLTPYAPRLIALQGKLRRLEIRQQGAQHVKNLFAQVGELLHQADDAALNNRAEVSGLVTAAIATEARARLLVFQGSWQPAELVDFERLSADLRP